MSATVSRRYRGLELAYAENTSNVTGIGSTIADITGLSISFTVGARPVMVELFIPLFSQVTSSGVSLFYIADGSNNQLVRGGGFTVSAGANGGGVVAKARLAAGLGAVTAKGRASTSAGTLTVNADPTAGVAYKPYIRAYEA